MDWTNLKINATFEQLQTGKKIIKAATFNRINTVYWTNNFSINNKNMETLLRLLTGIPFGSALVLRWFETVFHFPLQLNFMKGLLVCSKRLLLLVDSSCCNNL